MSVTTSLKLPDALKATIAQVALREGKTSHALMVETLQNAMDDAVLRDQFYAEAESSYRETLQTNRVYRGEDVKTYIMTRVNGGESKRPEPVPWIPSKPILDP